MGKLDDAKLSIDENITSNGNEAITGSILNAVMKEVVTAAQGAIDETEGKLTQLSQEWQEIKDANFQPTFEVLPHITKVIVTDGAAILEPDKIYDFGESAQIVVGFKPQENPQYAAQYAFQFKSPSNAPTSLTMPEGVIFPVESDSLLQIKAGLTYQITIVDNLAVATSWEA